MRVAQIIPCLGGNSGGPSRSVYTLTRGLRDFGLDTEIVSYNYTFNPNIAKEPWIRAMDVDKMLPFEYDSRFKGFLDEREYDLFHIHSIYSYPVTIAARLARKKNVPYIIAPRGSLYRSAIKGSSALKKYLFNHLFLFSDLNHASAIQATCKEELEEIRALGIKTPVAIIPNSVPIPEKMSAYGNPSKLRIGFLGRINPIKNLDGLLRAWKASGLDDEGELYIVGKAQLEKEQEYEKQLHELESELCLKNVIWTGAKFGKEKDDLLRSFSYLVLPSHSENFGMVVPEALLQGVPVIASKGTPWSMLEEHHCGWWVDDSVDGLTKGLTDVRTVSEDSRKTMSISGQKMVKVHFSENAVNHKLNDLYEWILVGGEKPKFVYG